jgi:thiamine pyrophosphate-dependent acetolactate synthase large subunit-like protein
MDQITLDRRGLLPGLFPDHRRYLFVAGLAGCTRDCGALTEGGTNLFPLGGAMGAAVAMGLGIALSVPDREVAVVTGDGELLMNIGVLASVATMMPANLTIVCIDNGSHGETGGQPGHTAHRTSLALMAEGAGLPSVMTIAAPGQIADAARFLAESQGPRFLWARVRPGPPSEAARNWDPLQNRLHFRDAFLAGARG